MTIVHAVFCADERLQLWAERPLEATRATAAAGSPRRQT